MSDERRRVISICGPSGSGKSTIARALVEALGPDRAARVPADYYLVDADQAALPANGFRWDWARLATDLRSDDGVVVETPDYDFVCLRRRAPSGGLRYICRPVMVVDAMRPFPDADIVVWLDVPPNERLRRVRERDARWGTRIADRWDAQEKGAPGERPPGTTVALDGWRDPDVVLADILAVLATPDERRKPGSAHGTGVRSS